MKKIEREEEYLHNISLTPWKITLSVLKIDLHYMKKNGRNWALR